MLAEGIKRLLEDGTNFVQPYLQVHEAGKLCQDRDVGPKPRNLQGDLIYLKLGDVQQHVLLFAGGACALCVVSYWCAVVVALSSSGRPWRVGVPSCALLGHGSPPSPPGFFCAGG